MLKDYDEGYKVIIAGSSGVGKSSLLLRFVDNVYSESLLSTIGVDFKFKTMDVGGKKVRMQIWDTAGSEAFRSIVSAYYRGANAVILVFALDDPFTFTQISTFWMEEVNKYKEKDCEIMILANKTDVSSQSQHRQQIQQFMKRNEITLYRETSARTGNQVAEAFFTLAQRLLTKKRDIRSEQEQKARLSFPRHPDSPEGQPKKNCC